MTDAQTEDLWVALGTGTRTPTAFFGAVEGDQGDHCLHPCWWARELLAWRTCEMPKSLTPRGSQRDSFNRAVKRILPQVPAEFVWCFRLRGLILSLFHLTSI
eukprot:s262_g15.t1